MRVPELLYPTIECFVQFFLMAMVTTLMQIQQSVLRRWYGLARACHCPQGGPDVRLHRESHRETQRDRVLGGEIEGREALGTKQERRLPDRDGALRGTGEHQGDEEGKENDQSEGRVKVGRREMGAQRWCAHTSYFNHVHFFVGHFARCSEVLVCLHPVLTWIWSR